MQRKSKNGIDWLEFEIFSQFPELIHGVILRHGGVSTGHCASLNIGGNTGDSQESICENRKRVLEALNIPQFISSYQVHSDTVLHITDSKQLDLEQADGLITQEANVGLLIKHADCQAAIFYDPINKALANIHAGWRGNVKNIYAKTIQKMNEIFGTQPQNLFVGISPSLGPDRSEFKNYKDEFPQSFWKFQIAPFYFDLWAIARMQLQECGVPSDHIQIASICTYSNPEDFFSYRRDKATGRNATIAALRN